MPALSYRQRDRLAAFGPGLALVPACAYFALVPYGTAGWAGLPWFLVHALNLLPHEAGHFFFRFFGEWMTYAGGSLLQVLFPCLFGWYFLTNDGRFGLQASLGWLGQNLVDVSVYAADAPHRALPLIGPLGPESHDWWNILDMAGALHHAPLVAGAIYALAFVAWALMLLVPLRVG